MADPLKVARAKAAATYDAAVDHFDDEALGLSHTTPERTPDWVPANLAEQETVARSLRSLRLHAGEHFANGREGAVFVLLLAEAVGIGAIGGSTGLASRSGKSLPGSALCGRGCETT